MPIIPGAAKKLRHDRKRTVTTMRVRQSMRNVVKAYRKSPSKKSLQKVFQSLDKAAKLNVIHANKSARLKSRLSKLLKK
ncbi:MAG TPA: 30S ribosomal protein S20 [Patescibacteria group bacterium]|jgi:ribosomal protein S20|nr:30S ribosomal protein S20 [Patescibacteria group bacterium]